MGVASRIRTLKLLLVVLAAGIAPVRAETVEGGQGVSGSAAALTREGVTAQLQLLERITTAPGTVARIESNPGGDAQQHLEGAIRARQRAAVALESGELAAAADEIRGGLQEMAAALRAAKDVSRQTAEDSQRYETLRMRVFSFSEAFQRIAYEKNDPATLGLLDQARLNNLLLEAQTLAANGQYAGAGDLMSEAADIVERALSLARDQETLLHELTFATPEDEYLYELRRNDSYAMLVNLLEQKPDTSAGALEAMRRALAENEAARKQALHWFDTGDVARAVATLEQSSERVAKVLRWSGLAF